MEDLKSKSQKKRDAAALQQFGVELIALSEERLNSLPLTDNLRRAISEAKRIKSHGAKKRQSLLIGKLLRSSEPEAILDAYALLVAEDSAQTANFHEIEQWRDKLINEGKEALTEFIQVHQPADVQTLRQHIKKAVDEKESDKHTGAAKALFRFLRSCLS
ncbi:MAG: DUF615 domain-containing protein [Tatlockia sp.]|nr:DUF615 domain-containing protein [Tatlockia sp.]